MLDEIAPGESRHQLARAVTALFVPGNRPDRFDKALAAEADVIVIDWEDAVAPDQKMDARAHTLKWILTHPKVRNRVTIRVNASDTRDHSIDLEVLAGLRDQLPGDFPAVMLAKSETPEALARLVNLAGSAIAVCALIESVLGLNMVKILAAVPGVERLAFGALDFSLDAGMDPDPDVMAFARQQIVLASRLAGIQAPLDSPETTISNYEAAYQAAIAAKRYGMTGKLCIHPNQVEPTRRGFSPTLEQIAWAKSVTGAGLNATQVGGKMVDRPVIERARQILKLQEGSK